MAESETQVETRTCKFPGCTVPPEPGESGVGRPPEYCKNPAHNRGAAWRARKLERAEREGQAVPDDLGRPVSMARARAGDLVDQVNDHVQRLSRTLTGVVEELKTLGDPDAAAAQIEAVTTEAEQRTAEAAARAARAVQDRREAEQYRAEADAAAEEAVVDVERLITELGEARVAHQVLGEAFALARQEHDQLMGERDQATADAQDVSTRAGLAEIARDSAQVLVEQLRAEQEMTRAEHATAVKDLRSERDRVSAELTSGRAEHARVVTELRTELETVRADHSRALEDLRADRDRVRSEFDTARTEHRQAMKDLRAEHVAATKVARDLSADRVVAAEATASDLRGQIEDLRRLSVVKSFGPTVLTNVGSTSRRGRVVVLGVGRVEALLCALA